MDPACARHGSIYGRNSDHAPLAFISSFSCPGVKTIPFSTKLTSIGLVLAAFSLLGAARANAQCEFNKIAEFDLKIENGAPLTSVTINGQQGYLLFSNRSNAAAIYKDAAEKLGLKPYATEFYSNINGKKTPVYGVHIDDLSLGGMKPTATDWFVVSRPPSSTTRLWGVLSTFIFEGDAVEFNFPDRKINLYSEKYCEGRLKAYWNPQVRPVETQKRNLSTFMGDVDGTPIAIEISSSQEFSTINDAGVKAAKLSLESNPEETSPGSSDTGADAKGSSRYSDKIAVAHRLEIAGEVLNDVRIRVSVTPPAVPSIPGDPVGNSRTYDTASPKIVLGVDYLLAHHVLISPIQHLVFTSSTGETPFKAIKQDVEGASKHP